VSKTDSNGPNRILMTMNAVMEIGFNGCSIDDIANHTRISYHSVRRALEALEVAEWAEELKQASSNQRLWRPGKKLLGLSFAYQRHCVGKIHSIENQYTEISGKRLRDEL